MLTDKIPSGRVIAAVRSGREFELACQSGCNTIFLLSSTILELHDYITLAASAGKKLFIHGDMTEGLAKDAAAVEFISKLKPFGIISTRGNMIKQAKSLGLCTVQRFFVVDGQSVKTALDTVRQIKPDYAEIMPGIACKVIKEFSADGFKTIAGGLITTSSEAVQALSSGAVAVSTSCQSLWKTK